MIDYIGRPKTPWWFWVISITAIGWNLIGVMDYFNSVTLNEAYLSEFDGMLEFVRDMPVWAKAVWGIAIAGSILGSLGLLLRKKWAYTLFVIAIIGMVLSFAYQWTAPNKVEVPSWVHIFTAIIWIIAIFLVWFSRKMTARGILT